MKEHIVYVQELITPKPSEGVRFEFDRFLHQPGCYHGLLLHQVGELCCNAGYDMPEHPQWCHEISYIVSGTGTFFINGTANDVGPGDLVISPKGTDHAIRAGEKEALRFTYLGFDFAPQPQTMDYKEIRTFFKTTKDYLKKNMQAAMEPFYLLIDEFCFSHPGRDLMIYSTMLQLLVLTYQNFSIAQRSMYSSNISETIVGQAVYEALHYINRNLFTMGETGSIAKALGYSQCYLSHVFREQTGQTLQSYVAEQKMKKSIELLQLGNYSVAMVAQQMGYGDARSFSKAFRRITGFSPTGYMKQLRT